MKVLTIFSILFLLLQTNITIANQAASGSLEQASGDVGQFVNTLIDKASTMLANKSLSESEKIKESKALLSQNLDFDWIADSSLGRNKKSLSPAEVQQFKTLYSQYVIQRYASLVKKYNGQKTKVLKVRPITEGKEYFVYTEVVGSNQAPLKVDYFIRKTTSELKVADIITEGVSFVKSQYEEFNSILKNEGGFNQLVKRLQSNPGK